MKTKFDIGEFASYNEIVCRLIYDFKISSRIKLIFVAYSIKNLAQDFKGSSQKYGAYELIMDGIKKDLNQNISQFCIIFECIEILKNQKYISIIDGTIEILKKPKISRTIDCLDSPLLRTAILEAEKLSADSLLRGVVEYV